MFKDFFSVPNVIPSHMIKWFAANKLVLNFDNMDIMNMWNKYIMEY